MAAPEGQGHRVERHFDEELAELKERLLLMGNRVEEIVARAAVGGVKVLMATHDLGQARRLAGDIALLARGRLVEHAPAESFFAAPATPEARSFLAGELVI